jgi:hypothetical protein
VASRRQHNVVESKAKHGRTRGGDAVYVFVISLAICVPWIFPTSVHTNDDVYGLSTVVSTSESDQILLVPYLLPYYFLKFGIDMWPYVLSRF